jgi:hypothetical protein
MSDRDKRLGGVGVVDETNHDLAKCRLSDRGSGGHEDNRIASRRDVDGFPPAGDSYETGAVGASSEVLTCNSRRMPAYRGLLSIDLCASSSSRQNSADYEQPSRCPVSGKGGQAA